MAVKKVSIQKQYHGDVPRDPHGQTLPPDQWSGKRNFSWVVRWYGTNGRRLGKSFSSKAEAQRFAERKQLEVRENRGDPLPGVTLKAFAKEHRELMKGNIAPSTLHMQLAALGLLAGAVGWDRHIARIHVRDIERFRAARLKTGINPITANKEVKLLRRIFNLAIRRGYLRKDANPCVDMQMLKVAQKMPVYLAPEDFKKLLAEAKTAMWKAMLMLFYSTGLRRMEAVNLAWSDIDFEKSMVTVARKPAGGLIQAWSPKDHELRSIPVPRQVLDMLTSWQTMAPEGCPYVFLEQARWDYYRNAVEAGTWSAGAALVNNVLRKFKTICRRAKLKSFTIHDLRRSCITNWASNLPIHVVKQLAGHSDIKTTQQFYLSVQDRDIIEAQQVQEKILGDTEKFCATDKLLTNNGQKRHFPGSGGCKRKSQVPD